MINYIMSGMCLAVGAYLAYSHNDTWPWFFGASVFMFFIAAGAAMKEKDK